MLCKGVVYENSRMRACWLPADRSSSFQLCRRCHFHKVTDALDNFTREYRNNILHPPNECMLADQSFLEELLHPAREQALLNLLSTLYQKNKIQLMLLMNRLKHKKIFTNLLTKRILAHQPGPRCSFYRCCMKDEDIYTASSLPWNCWSCIAWTVKQKEKHLLTYYNSTFGLHFSRLTFQVFSETGPRDFIDYFVSLHLNQKDHHIRILIDHMMRTFPLEDFKSFLLGFLEQPAMLYVFYQKKQDDFLPLPLRDKVVVQEFKKQIQQSIKNRTNNYKEELVMKTWHPKRLFPWCLDIQELAEFGFSNNDSGLFNVWEG